MNRPHCSTSALLATLLTSLAALTSNASDWPQWRGPLRNGISTESGLRAEWPTNGPVLRWCQTNIGSGYATPSVAGKTLYVLGNDGLDNEFVQALQTEDGKQIWRTRLGKVGNPDQKPPYPGARSTPTVDGEVLFALSSDGDLACVELASGKTRWQKNLRTDFDGKPGIWAYSESPLVDGDTVVVTPGGATATLAAFNKKTGEVIWKCALPDAGEAAYASAILVEAAGHKQYVQHLQKGLVGVDAKTGKLLWRYNKAVSKFRANIPTPLAEQDRIYTCGAGTGGGLIRLSGKDGGVEATEVYFSPKLPTTIGGAVKVGDYLYGTTAQAMLCVEFATGNVKWEERALGAASLCCAGGQLYLHAESGEVALVTPSPEGYREQGRFTPPDQPKRINPMEKAWAFPVVANGRLYIRDHHLLYCYDVRAGN